MEMIELKKYNNRNLKNLLDGLKSGVQMRENRISELEDRAIEFIQYEQQRENK